MQRPMRLAVWAAALAATGAVALGVPGAPAKSGARITAKGVGPVKLGMRFDRARERGLVGQAKPSCAEIDPGARFARLEGGLEGTVDLTDDSPRRIARISVEGGATARGVGIGDPLSQVRAAYPSAKVDKRRAPTFGFWFARVPRSGGGRIEFTVEVRGSHDVFQIDVPRAGYCE